MSAMPYSRNPDANAPSRKYLSAASAERARPRGTSASTQAPTASSSTARKTTPKSGAARARAPRPRSTSSASRHRGRSSRRPTGSRPRRPSWRSPRRRRDATRATTRRPPWTRTRRASGSRRCAGRPRSYDATPRTRAAPAPMRSARARAGAKAADRRRRRDRASPLSSRRGRGLVLRRSRLDLLDQLPRRRLHAPQERLGIDPDPEDAGDQRREHEELARREGGGLFVFAVRERVGNDALQRREQRGGRDDHTGRRDPGRHGVRAERAEQDEELTDEAVGRGERHRRQRADRGNREQQSENG